MLLKTFSELFFNELRVSWINTQFHWKIVTKYSFSLSLLGITEKYYFRCEIRTNLNCYHRKLGHSSAVFITLKIYYYYLSFARTRSIFSNPWNIRRCTTEIKYIYLIGLRLGIRYIWHSERYGICTDSWGRVIHRDAIWQFSNCNPRDPHCARGR